MKKSALSTILMNVVFSSTEGFSDIGAYQYFGQADFFMPELNITIRTMARLYSLGTGLNKKKLYTEIKI